MEMRISGLFGQSKLYQYEQFNFHPRAIEILGKLERLKFKKSDILLTMFPKSGSTWLSECIYLIEHQYHYEVASKQSIEYRFPQIDSPTHDVFDLIVEQQGYDLSRARMIKASVPASLLVDHKSTIGQQKLNIDNKEQQQQVVVRPRVVSIVRNPRDVLVSFYHHCKTVKHYNIDWTFDDFYESFISGQVPCGPIWLMYNEMFEYCRLHPENSLLIQYEDMKRDLRGQIMRLCQFLSRSPPRTEDDWAHFMDHLSVERMRQNRTINRHDWTAMGLRNEHGVEFVRKGQVNDWENYFTREQSERFDREITAKLLEPLRVMYPPLATTSTEC